MSVPSLPPTISPIADSSPPTPASHGFHRGDPLDIPYIDDHLLYLLFPRIISAIRYVYPNLHSDWSNFIPHTGENDTVVPNSGEIHQGNSIKHMLIPKYVVMAILRASLVLGSYRHRRLERGSVFEQMWITTPAMRSFGMSLKPINETKMLLHGGIPARVQKYNKIIALVVLTVIIPSLYEELNNKRHKELEQSELLRRSFHILRNSNFSNDSRHHRQRETHSIEAEQRSGAAVLKERSRKRKAYLQRLITDTVLGIADIILPPLRLFCCLSYLWGHSFSPDLGMRLVGWDYAELSSKLDSTGCFIDGNEQAYQRHASFHYGHRRLLVEESLRTLSNLLPQRNNPSTATMMEENEFRRRAGSHSLMDNGSRNDSSNQIGRNTCDKMVNERNFLKASWVRKRALSFLGIIEEGNEYNHVESINNNQLRHSLKCSICNIENPVIPYVASCGHCYCYVCLRMAVTDDIHYRCSVCGVIIVSSSPYSKTTYNNKTGGIC